ncbi:hypothetical protein MD484_g7843, partial [Candolleomyces efflorescens]
MLFTLTRAATIVALIAVAVTARPVIPRADPPGSPSSIAPRGLLDGVVGTVGGVVGTATGA